jgi:hypothetical protein
MDGIGARVDGRSHDRLDVEEVDGARSITGRLDDLDPETPPAPSDAPGDLAAVRDEQSPDLTGAGGRIGRLDSLSRCLKRV